MAPTFFGGARGGHRAHADDQVRLSAGTVPSLPSPAPRIKYILSNADLEKRARAPDMQAPARWT